MEITTIELRKLTASEGMMLTNGETYSYKIYLACNDSPENWTEITKEEAERLQAAQKPAIDIPVEEIVQLN